MNDKILFVDDDPTMRDAVELAMGDYQISVVASEKEAIENLREETFDLLLTDLCLPQKEQGLALVQQARQMDEDLFIVVITGFGTIESTVEAMKRGADDYITKEFSAQELKLKVAKYFREKKQRIKYKKLQAENILLKTDAQKGLSLIGDSMPIQQVRHKINKLGKEGDSPVLILGNSGTGKELVANEIHGNSPRHNQPFIAIDCPTIGKDLFETELFGYEKGAFTDAKSRKLGRIELADGGTLFLDEIADLPLALQPKLLRFLETSTFYRVGGTQPVTVDVRILSSTNRNLADMVADGNFREDLFYRLQVVTIILPDLRERAEDIQLLAQYFLNQINARKKSQLSFTAEQIGQLMSHNWPGNVRELKNAVTSFAILGEFPQHKHKQPFQTLNFREAKSHVIDSFEREFITRILAENGNNISKAASAMGLSREVLSRKIKHLKIDTR